MATEALAIGTVMPLVEEDLGDLWLYGWVFAAFGIGQFVGIPTGGHLADRTDPTFVLLGGLAVFTAGLLLGGLAPSMPVLVAGRLLQGMGAGVVPATAYTVIGRAIPDVLRPKMFAAMSTAWVVPGLVSPLLAAWVGERIGWRWVFLGLIPIVAVGAALVVIAFRGPIHDRLVATTNAEHPLPLRTIGALAMGVTALLAGLAARSVLPAVVLAVAGGALTLNRLAALAPAGTLRCRPGLPAAVLLRGVLTAAFFTTDVYLALALMRLRGTSATMAGLALGIAAVTWTAGAWLQARLIPRWGARVLVRAGMAIVSLGVVLTGMVVLGDTVPPATAILTWSVAAFGIGCAYAPLSLTVLSEAEPGREGSSSAALQLFDSLGLTVGPGVAAAFIAAADRGLWTLWAALATTITVSTVIGLVGSALAGRLPGPRAGHQVTASQPV